MHRILLKNPLDKLSGKLQTEVEKHQQLKLHKSSDPTSTPEILRKALQV